MRSACPRRGKACTSSAWGSRDNVMAKRRPLMRLRVSLLLLMWIVITGCAASGSNPEATAAAEAEHQHHSHEHAVPGHEKETSKPPRIRTPRQGSTRRDEKGSEASGTHSGRNRQTSITAHFTDSDADREGAEDAPFIEIVMAEARADRGELIMTIRTAEPLPATMPDEDDLAIFAFAIDTRSASYSLSAQVRGDGWSKAKLESDDVRRRVPYTTGIHHVRFRLPWNNLGVGQPMFEWTAVTALVEWVGAAPTHAGRDAVPAKPASFPPS